MKYKVYIRRSAERDMRRLLPNVLKRIHARIQRLAEEPFAGDVKKLRTGLGFRARVGDYRIIFVVNESEQVVEIVAVKKREEAYR